MVGDGAMADTQKTIANDLIYYCKNLFSQRNSYRNRISEDLKLIMRNLGLINKKFGYGGSIVLFIFTVLFFSSGLLLLLCNDYDNSSAYYKKSDPFCVYGAISLWFIALIFLILALACMFTAKRNRGLKKQAIAANQELMKNIDAYRGEVVKIEKELLSYNLLHRDYWYAGDVILNYIIVGRAATIMDAINLFELERQVDKQMQQNLIMMQQLEKDLKDIKWNTSFRPYFYYYY